MRLTQKCPRCDAVNVLPGDLDLFVDPVGATAEFAFDCTGCSTPVRAPCDQPTARLLMLRGARVNEQPAAAQPISSVTDEVIAFRQLLATDDWFERHFSEPPRTDEAA